MNQRKHTEEHKKKISEAGKGRIPWNKGKKIDKEKYPNYGMQGRKHSTETKKKISEIQMGRVSPKKGKESGVIPWNKGLTKETSEKVKKIHEKLTSEIRREIMKKVHKNRTKEEKEDIARKIGLKHKGKKVSKDTKRKISKNSKRTKWTKERKEYMSKIMSGKNNPFYGKKLTEEHRDKIRKKTLRYLQEVGFKNKTNTSIEIVIKKELISRGYKEDIDFIHQYNFNNKFMCDFCFPKEKVIIEADGDFWHANPKIYDKDKLYPIQIKDIKRDKAKNAYIKKCDNGSWKLLRFWECDINKDVSRCIDILEVEIKNE